MAMFYNVSIVVPIYNAKKYLNCCINTILQQTYENFELMLVDDGSTDGSLEICNNYERDDKRVKVIHKVNGGVSSARNAGIESATGDYILFIDSDDYIEENYIQTLVENCSDDCDLVVCGFTYDFGSKKTENKVEEVNCLTIEEYKKKFNSLYAKSLTNSPFGKLYKSELVKDIAFDISVPLGEDLIFNLDYLKRCKNIKIIPYAGYFYNQTNVSSATKKYKTEYYDCIIKCYEKSKLFVYGEIKNCGDAIDCTFCDNCINQTQLIYESQLNKKQKKETILTILNNKRFSAIMKDCKPNLRYPLRTLLCTRKQVGLLFIYYRLKKLVKKFLKKKSY